MYSVSEEEFFKLFLLAKLNEYSVTVTDGAFEL
jgi:hypothetical protein